MPAVCISIYPFRYPFVLLVRYVARATTLNDYSVTRLKHWLHNHMRAASRFRCSMYNNITACAKGKCTSSAPAVLSRPRGDLVVAISRHDLAPRSQPRRAISRRGNLTSRSRNLTPRNLTSRKPQSQTVAFCVYGRTLGQRTSFPNYEPDFTFLM